MDNEATKKNIEENNKEMMESLNRYLDDYAGMLLDELEAKDIIKIINPEDKNGPKKYQLTSLTKESTVTSTETPSKEKRVVQEFYDFRNIVYNVFHNIKTNDPMDSQAITLSKMVNRLVDYKAFDPAWRNVSLLKDFLDKADDLLVDVELQSSTVALLESYKVNFNNLILELLKFHAKYIINKNFDVESMEEIQKKEKSSADFVIRLKGKKSNLLVEVKFRKKNVQIKELIQQCQEILRKYGEKEKIKNHILLVVYTYENLGEIERSKFRFKQNIDGPFKELERYVHFMPIQMGTFTNLPTEIAFFKDSLSGEETKIEFIFRNQPAISGHPEADDHYFPEIFDLQKHNYEVRFKTARPPEHWRFGIKFSIDDSFLPVERRHVITHPVFHLEKNEDKADHLLYSYYGTATEDLGKPTTLQNYHGELIVFKIYTQNSETIVEAFDHENNPILQAPVNVNGFKYFKVFAWADGRNPFEFDAEILIRD